MSGKQARLHFGAHDIVVEGIVIDNRASFFFPIWCASYLALIDNDLSASLSVSLLFHVRFLFVCAEREYLTVRFLVGPCEKSVCVRFENENRVVASFL